MIGVTFDYGQTLASLDFEVLSRRVGERGASVAVSRLEAASEPAWTAYNEAKRRGAEGEAAWREFMTQLLSLAGAHTPEESLGEIVSFLWSEQPRYNLWRRPIDGMFELCSRLAESATPVGIVSNSEGRLVELLDELSQRELFQTIADSGVLGFEKPDHRIFDWAAARLGVHVSDLIHVGDAWEADVRGVLDVGGRAIWFSDTKPDTPQPSQRIRTARSAREVSEALRSWGVAV